jgi:ATPase subunit of ABC transporter with duplicated ATPase domains
LTPTTGSISINGSIAMLRQTVQPGPDEWIADLFGARAASPCWTRPTPAKRPSTKSATPTGHFASGSTTLAEVGLRLAAETPLAALSGGQRTRAALARRLRRPRHPVAR